VWGECEGCGGGGAGGEVGGVVCLKSLWGGCTFTPSSKSNLPGKRERQFCSCFLAMLQTQECLNLLSICTNNVFQVVHEMSHVDQGLNNR